MHMAGYNKKAVVDAKRGKLFTKMSRLITMAVKEAGGDADHSSVAVAIERAKKVSVPKDIIEKAVKKGSDKNAAAMEAVTYEGYGPGGVALIINALTDNRNRTGQEVRHAFSKHGFEMGVPGSAAWAFVRNPEGDYQPLGGTEVGLAEADQELLELLVKDIEALDDVSDVVTNKAH